jgi:hypothetical protein
MSKTEKLKITLNNKTWEPKGLFGTYIESMFVGISSGAIIGGYVGAVTGFTAAALSPGIIGYGLFRAGRKILRR